ncbi:MAG: TlpA family protein disulfide reductase, partial [Planctomycetales bacterium]|nr:TlpA family protein disulfide reductase [Planctomycetales bacterium]
ICVAGDKWGRVEGIVGKVGESGCVVEQLQLTLTVVDFLGDMESDELAKEMLNKVMPGFRQSKDEQVQSNLPMIEGIVRRINLPGQRMELHGTMLDGTPLDWESYRGKVVLVDFWATWCGPCRQEVPNVLKQYHAYHDKGFDVLGISLDKTAADANSYIEQAEIPWATLFSENETERGWEHPMARYYGISGIPRAILVDRDGTVVSMNARGKELARLLRKMLGEPLASTETVEDNLVKQVSDQSEVK